MNPSDFVFIQIYHGAKARGAKELTAHQCAVTGLDEYKKNKFSGKVSEFIQRKINEAVKQSKQSK